MGTAQPHVASLSHGRNEAEYLGTCLDSINNQTLKPYVVLYVDDYSSDNSVAIANEKGAITHCLLTDHENWTMSPMLATIYNKMFEELEQVIKQQNLQRPDYYFIGGCDAVYPPTYIEDLVAQMTSNPKLAACSGVLRDEPCGPRFARGLGRLYRAAFWDKYVQRVPVKEDWETEPLRIAWANGYVVQSFPQIKFDGRPTGVRR